MPRLTFFLFEKVCLISRMIRDVLPTSLSPTTKILKLTLAKRLKATEDFPFIKIIQYISKLH